MTEREEELARRRRALTLRSERLRRQMAEDAEVVGDTVSRFDDAIASARRHASPALLLAGGALLLFLLANPARSLAWITRGAMLLSVARRGLAIYRQVRSELPPPHG
jgi:YqjK-like protein